MRCIKKVRIYSTVDDIDRGERDQGEWMELQGRNGRAATRNRSVQR